MQTLADRKVGDWIYFTISSTANLFFEIAGLNVHAANSVTLVNRSGIANIPSTAFGTNGTYAGSALDTYCETTLFDSFPALIREAAITADVDVATSATSGTTIQRRCFALSQTEVGLGNNGTTAENAALPLFTQMTRIRGYTTPAEWRLRSWASAATSRTVTTTGALSTAAVATSMPIFYAIVLPTSIATQSSFASGGGFGVLRTLQDWLYFEYFLDTTEKRPKKIFVSPQYKGGQLFISGVNNAKKPVLPYQQEEIPNGKVYEFINRTPNEDGKWGIYLSVALNITEPNIPAFINEFPILIEYDD